MSLIQKTRKLKFGTCCFCGGKVKFYQRSHKECLEKFKDGQNKILSLSKNLSEQDFNAHFFDNLIKKVEKSSFINTDEKKALLVQCWEDTVDLALEQGCIPKKIEDNLSSFAEHFDLTQDDLSCNNKFCSLVKGIVLRKLSEGIVPDNMKVEVTLPFNFLKDEKIIWVFQNVEYLQIRQKTRYEGSSIGGSVKIAEGIYLRQSYFNSFPVSYPSLEYIDTGVLVVTDRHIYFGCSFKNFRVKYDKIVSFMPYSDAIGIQRDAMTAQPQIFKLEDGWFAYNLLMGTVKLHH